jgi:hypothetical protein
MIRVSLQVDLYMTRKEQVFIVDVMVIDPTWEMVALNVINWPTCATMKLNTIVKIRKYRRLHENHHLNPMAMEVHGAYGCNMDCFIKECAHLFHDRQSKWLFIFVFCIQFFRHHVNIFFQHALAFTIERKITLASNVYSKPLIIIRCHDLHASDIRGAVGEIAFYRKR